MAPQTVAVLTTLAPATVTTAMDSAAPTAPKGSASNFPGLHGPRSSPAATPTVQPGVAPKATAASALDRAGTAVPQTPDAPADPPLPAHQRTLTSGTNQLTTEQAIPAVSGPGQTERATADEAIRPLPETQAAITPAAITPAAITSAAITSALSNQVATAPAITPAAVSPQASASPPVAPVHTDTPPQPAAPLPAPAPPPAAAQLAPAFATLSASASGTSGTTPQSLVIRLAPVELGHVQVRIDQTADGTSHVVLAVERNDTLMLLLQDRPQLNQALDAAGISPDGRTLQLNLADPSTGSTPSGPGTGGTGTGSGSGSGGAGGGAQGQDNPGGGQRQPPAIAWQRAGVDITA